MKLPEISRSRWLWIAGVGGVAALLIVFLSVSRGGAPEGSQWVIAERGEFVIDLVESGDIRAANSQDVKAPMVGSDLQIIEMVPEGSIVQAGDVLVQFDPVSLEKDLVTRRENLATSEAELEALDTEQNRDRAAMESNLTASKYSQELAQIKLERMKFESPLKQRQTDIEYRQQMLALDEETTRLKNQKVIDAAARYKVLRQVEENRERVKTIEQRIKDLILYAPIGGLVVYNEIGGRGTPLHKVAVGDKPWPSQSIISIPDASKIQVVARVNEVDASKLAVGDHVDITLDAFENARYKGKVSRVASLADRRDAESPVKDFEAAIDIDEPDTLLKPGMTAKTRIVLSRYKDVVFVPIGAVFEQKDGTPVVFTRKNPDKPTPVTLGKRNDRFIIIAEGVHPGDRLSLTQPATGGFYPLGRARDRELRVRELQRLKAAPDSLLAVPESNPDREDSSRMNGKRQRNGANPQGISPGMQGNAGEMRSQSRNGAGSTEIPARAGQRRAE